MSARNKFEIERKISEYSDEKHHALEKQKNYYKKKGIIKIKNTYFLLKL